MEGCILSRNRNRKEYNQLGYQDLVREFYKDEPKDVDGVFNTSSTHYRRKLYKLVYSMFKMSMPKEWNRKYFYRVLFQEGMIGITDTALGVIPLRVAYTGLDVWDMPTTMMFSNHILGNFEKTIDVNGVLITMDSDFGSMEPVVQKYATLLAMCDSSIAVNLMNSKVAFIGLADSKVAAESLRKIYDQLSAGNPAVFMKRSEEVEFYFNNVSNTFVADKIQLLKRTFINEFLTDIGINNINSDKKERQITDEVNANNMELEAMITNMYENIKEGFDKANAMFPGLNLSIEWRFKPSEPTESAELESESPGRGDSSGRDGQGSDDK